MFASKIFLATVLLVGASARHISWDDAPYGFDEDYRHQDSDIEPGFQDFQYQHPGYLASARVRRQAQGSVTLNGDGGIDLSGKVPLAGGGDKVGLSAIGSTSITDKFGMGSKGVGLALDANGHGIAVKHDQIAGFGSRLTGAGHATLYHDDKHDVVGKAFVARNMPDFPNAQNFNTVGGGLDYTFKDKVGASLSMSRTPFLDRKDYSAMGNLNVFRSPTSSVDFSAGFRKMDMPSFSTGWKPDFGVTYSRSFSQLPWH